MTASSGLVTTAPVRGRARAHSVCCPERTHSAPCLLAQRLDLRTRGVPDPGRILHTQAEPFVWQDEVFNFTYYGYDPAARLISVRNSAGHSWEDGGTTPMPE